MKNTINAFEEMIANRIQPATRGEGSAIRAYRFGSWTDDGILIVDDLDFAQYVGDMMDAFMTAGIDELIITDSSTATVKNNQIKKCKHYGLLVSDDSRATASGNKITKAGKKAMRTIDGGLLNGKTQ